MKKKEATFEINSENLNLLITIDYENKTLDTCVSRESNKAPYKNDIILQFLKIEAHQLTELSQLVNQAVSFIENEFFEAPTELVQSQIATTTVTSEAIKLSSFGIKNISTRLYNILQSFLREKYNSNNRLGEFTVDELISLDFNEFYKSKGIGKITILEFKKLLKTIKNANN